MVKPDKPIMDIFLRQSISFYNVIELLKELMKEEKLQTHISINDKKCVITMGFKKDE